MAGYIDHVILWRVQFYLRAGFWRPFSSFSSLFFSSLRAVRHRCRRFHELFFGFSVCFFEGLVHMPRNTVNSISASLEPSGPASSPRDESAPSTTSNSTSSSSFTSSPSSVSISAETLTQAISQAFQQSLPQMLAAFRENRAPNSTSGTSGNSSAASFGTSVPSTYTSTSTACRSSSLAGSVTVPAFLSTYSSVGIPVVPRASQPLVPALSAPSLFDQQPDLGAFGRKSVCSWPRLRANSRETGGHNNQWRLR